MWHRNFNEVNFHSARIAFLNNFNKKVCFKTSCLFDLNFKCHWTSNMTNTKHEQKTGAAFFITFSLFVPARSERLRRGTARWLHVRGTINPEILDIEVLAVLPFTHYSSTTRIALLIVAWHVIALRFYCLLSSVWTKRTESKKWVNTVWTKHDL